MKVSELIDRLREADPDARVCLELVEGNDIWNESIETMDLKGFGTTSKVVLLPRLPIVMALGISRPQERLYYASQCRERRADKEASAKAALRQFDTKRRPA